MNPLPKKILIAIVAASVLIGGGIGLRQASIIGPAKGKTAPGSGSGAPPAMTVRVAEAKSAAMREDVSAIGTLLANESITIRSEVDGRITHIYFREGEPVALGAKLISLNAAETEAQLKAAQADSTLNQTRLARAEELFGKNFISGQALDEAREHLNQSVARTAEIQARLDKTLIRAPFPGVVGVRQVSVGAYINKGQDIARLEGVGRLKVDFRVPEMFAGRIKPGQAIVINVDAFPQESFDGEIFAIEPAVDEQTRTVLLRAHVPNPKARLKPGMFARVALLLGMRENAVTVPEQAIVPRGQNFFVFKVVNGKVAFTKVELGMRRPGEVQLLKGVAPGDVVVTDGQLRIKDGAPVNISTAPPRS